MLLRPFSSKVSRVHRPLYAAPVPGKDAEEWMGCKVISNEADAIGLRNIAVDITDSRIGDAYTNPGQYLKLKTDEGEDTKPSFLAIASPPQQKQVFNFLIKETENNAVLTTIKPGESVYVTMPGGNGFKMQESFKEYRNDFPVNNVYLMACGSGIAPIASAIESGMLNIGQTSLTSIVARTGTLYIGAKTPLYLPFQSKYEKWEKDLGIKVVPVISQPNCAGSARWTGATGYIQDALKADGVSVPKNTAALLCGMKGMTEAVKELCLEDGVYEGRILFNF